MIDLNILNPEQKAAVTAPPGPVLVLAGAGSGKTRVLTYRIAYMLEQGWVEPRGVLALTFTNKAAREMVERLQNILGLNLAEFGSFVGTFHALGVKILRAHGQGLGLKKDFTIIDQDDRLKLLKEIAGSSEDSEDKTHKIVAHMIHRTKNSLEEFELGLRNLPAFVSRNFVRIYEEYEARMLRSNLVDLDDLVYLPYRLLKADGDLAKYYQQKFKAIFVDEYQDTNPVQYELVRLLVLPRSKDKVSRASKQDLEKLSQTFSEGDGLSYGNEAQINLTVVGDDAQSIYGFRGSDVANILRFEKDFPEGKVFALEQNYRSTSNILATAEKIILHSKNQLPKKMWTEKPGGEKVVVKELFDDNAEASFIANTISKLVQGIEVEEPETYEQESEQPFSILDYLLAQKKGQKSQAGRYVKFHGDTNNLSGFAVLYRTHAQSRALEAAMVACGLPYKIYGGIRFFERKEIKDVVALLRLQVNPFDSLALSRAVSSIPRGIGPKTLQEINLFLADVDRGGNVVTWSDIQTKVEDLPGSKGMQAFKKFTSTMADLEAVKHNVLFAEWLENLLNVSGLLEHHSKDEDLGEERKENLNELLNVASQYGNVSWKEGLIKLLEEAALLGEADSVESGNYVTLMTLHASKGLEFNNIFFAGLEEGLVPHMRSFENPAEMDEEARLAYVGVTRARERLFLTYARRRGARGYYQDQQPSRFLRGISGSFVTLKGARAKFLDLGDGELSYEPIE